MLYALLILVTLLTSVISGLFSMAGGIVLMAVFGFFLSVPAAMVLHGVAQAFSNGSRIWLYREHIKWSVLAPYSAGAAVVLLTFASISFVPQPGLVFLLIGTFPFLTLLLPESLNLDMTRKPVALTCGVVVTLAQMLAGVAGPLLDVFYLNSKLNRYEILGTKATTQTLGHIIKLSYYSVFLFAASREIPIWIIPGVVLAAVAGNTIARLGVRKISDDEFRTAGRYLILLIGMVCLGKGVYDLFIT